MRYLSVCAGIEAATVAWHSLGWVPAAFSEIDPFPRAVLAHHYPEVPLHGDFTTIERQQYGAIDLLVGGTPCQSFSIAGFRGGLDDDRGNLALEYLRLADRTRPRWILWENVTGVLSSNGGRDFGTFLGGLAMLGYGFAYRVLDARHFGTPQRRRRVFVVGYRGSWQRAAAVLFERQSLRWHPAPLPEARRGSAGETEGGVDVYRLRAFGEYVADGTASAMQARDWKDVTDLVVSNEGVRRFTPRERERLQGFPDDYTRIPWEGSPAHRCPDEPRIKAIGNSMAVPVMRWLGERIAMVERLQEQAA